MFLMQTREPASSIASIALSGKKRSVIYLAVKLNLTKLPTNVSWLQLYGVAVLTGVGFTMSLFIDSLAYVDSSIFFYTDKLAILLGSLFSGIIGYIILLNVKKKKLI